MKPMFTMIPLGGIGTITKNMYVYEYKDQVLLVDCGIGFPDPTMLGVDVLIPDVQYLQDKLERIQGMVLTHAHDDHIAGLPYILPQLDARFPIYGSKLTIGFAKNRLKEFGIDADFRELTDDTLSLGEFRVDNIHMTHSVPDARHLVVTTEAGSVYHGSDFKFDLEPVDGVYPDLQKIAVLSHRYSMVGLLSDCLNSESSEFSSSESTLNETFQREMRGVKGKVIVTVMSSNIHRVQLAVNVAQKYQRKVAFVGRSMEQNVRTAVALGFLKLPNIVINRKKIADYPPDKLCVIIAGSQGQTGSSLVRAAEGEHAYVKIEKKDKVIFASEPIPGNEQDVYATIDSISRTGADVSYSDIAENMHVSGHSSEIEQKLLINLVRPVSLVPIGGTYHHMIQYRKLARSMGYADERIHLLENGQMLAFDTDAAEVTHTIKLNNVMVDGLGIGDVGQIVLRDRQQMADEGVVIIVVPVQQQTGQIGGEIEIITRGFVYVKESQELISKIKERALSCLKPQEQVVTNWQRLRKKIELSVEKLLYEETERQPLILTVILEV